MQVVEVVGARPVHHSTDFHLPRDRLERFHPPPHVFVAREFVEVAVASDRGLGRYRPVHVGKTRVALGRKETREISIGLASPQNLRFRAPATPPPETRSR